jgi:hypothetical protein
MSPREAARVLARDRCLLFVGSGVSIPRPSNLPSALGAVTVFLESLSEGILDPDSVRELVDHRKVLPEFVYGVVERHFGDRVYDIWRSLELWREYDGAFAANAGHLAAVHVAARSGMPVLTPNFDTFLEEAAGQLGLEVRVTVAAPERRFVPTYAGSGQVAVWKLHGTATDPTTIFSSVRTLTSPVPGLGLHLRKQLTSGARLVLAGYSGRDLDLFPVLAARQLRPKPMWVDLDFDPDHRSRILCPPATEVAAPFDEVGRQYARLCGGTVQQAANDSELLASNLRHRTSAPVLTAAVTSAICAIARELSEDMARRLVFAELSINAGRSRLAVELLRSTRPSGTPCTTAQASERARLLAKAHWELGAFKTSRSIAAQRLPDAAPNERHSLRFAVSAADARELVPPPDLAGVSPIPRRELVSAGFAAVTTYVRAACLSRHPWRVEEPTRTPFVEGRIEHGVRLVAALHTMLARGNGAFAPVERFLLRVCWRTLRRRAQLAGYAEGVGNAERYLARLGTNTDGGRNTQEFLQHHLGVAIAHRDAASRAHRDGHLAEAQQHLTAGLAVARAHDDPVLMLTFAPVADALGEPIDIDEALLETIEARWAAAHLAWRRRTDRKS